MAPLTVLCNKESNFTEDDLIPWISPNWKDCFLVPPGYRAVRYPLVELNKDELTVHRTRGSMSDVGNTIIRDGDLEAQEKFNSIWTSFAFSQDVTMQNRFIMMAKFVIEAEKGFPVYNSTTNQMEWVFPCFGFYTADQKELCAACGSVNHTGLRYGYG